MPDYKNPLAPKKDKPKVKTYNFTAEQLRPELVEVAERVLTLHHREQIGIAVKRVLPSAYLWFSGDGIRNTFRDAYGGGNLMVFGG